MAFLHIYTRVSTTSQESQGTSLTSQQEMGIARANELGLEYQLWNEGGQSSKFEDLHNRPVLRKLLLAVEEGTVQHIFVFNTDRLSRNQRTWGGIRWKLKQNRVKLYTSTGTIDLSSPMDELIIGILGEIAQYDNALRSERSQIGKLKKVQDGYWMGGPPPFGYMSHDGRLIESVDESKWVQWMYKQYNDGTPIIEIKSELEKNGVLTRRMNPSWSVGTIQKILQNRLYTGSYTYHDKKLDETVNCTCPPLIPYTDWVTAQSKRKEMLRRKGQHNRTQHSYLLRDYMYCDHCGRTMSARSKKTNREQHYYCPDKERNWHKTKPVEGQKWMRGKGCDMVKCLNIPHTDDIVWTSIIQALSSTDELHTELSKSLGINESYRKRRTVLRRDMKDIQDLLDHLDASLVELETDYRMGKINKEIYNRVICNLYGERNTLTERFEQRSALHDRMNDGEQWLGSLAGLCIDRDRLTACGRRERSDWLKRAVRRIGVRYDHTKKEHELTVSMSIPLFNDDHLGVAINRPESGTRSCPRTNHSTVTDLARLRG